MEKCSGSDDRPIFSWVIRRMVWYTSFFQIKNTGDNIARNSSKEVLIYFAKALALVRIESEELKDGLCRSYRKTVL